jgi:hypothetical protein
MWVKFVVLQVLRVQVSVRIYVFNCFLFLP